MATDLPNPSTGELHDELSQATSALLGATMSLDDDQWREPSRLPGWTRAHVGAHLALNAEAMGYLDAVGLADKAHRIAGPMSHGEHRQLEIATALATRPRMLLLDEPLAGTSGPEAEALVALLQRLKGQVTIALIEHDMDAVFALADRVSVLVYGRIIASGTPEEIRADAAVREAYLGEEELHA